MATADFFGDFRRQSTFGFERVQVFFFEVLANGSNLNFSGNNKKYTITRQNILQDGTIIDSTYTIKGNLSLSKPFNKRQIKSVIFEEVASNGEFARAEYKGLKGIKLDKFIDPSVNSVRKAFKGNDILTGNAGESVILNGFAGDDEILLKTDNRAFGGAGFDSFLLTKDTRNAEIFDFNPNKDTINLADDLNSNYNLFTNFGQTFVTNQNGEVLVRINDFSDPDVIAEMTGMDVLFAQSAPI